MLIVYVILPTRTHILQKSCSLPVADRPASRTGCEYTNDGECHEPDLCPYGTDTADFSGLARPQAQVERERGRGRRREKEGEGEGGREREREKG
mgnify:CR=1 FL=1